jgi:MFS family permease
LVTSPFVIVPQIVTALIATWLARKADEAGRKNLLIAAFAALFARSTLFAINFGPWFSVGVQVLGGLTAAVVGILTPLVVADLARQSGRYNFRLALRE